MKNIISFLWLCIIALVLYPEYAYADVVIIDNGDAETSSIGVWNYSSGADYFGTQSRFSRTVDGSYSYQTALSGDYIVSLWWTEWASRCTDIPVEIYDGATLLDTISVNHQQNGGQWNPIGTGAYTFTGQAVVKVVSTGLNDCTTCADAVRFESSLSSGNTAPQVSITAPSDGAAFNQGDAITFSGTATDTEDGDISASLTWSSSLDGAIGSGASFSTSALSAGMHTITASVTDSGNLSGSSGISVNVHSTGSVNVLFDFSTDTTSQFTVTNVWNGQGVFLYDSVGQRAQVITGDNTSLVFSYDVPPLSRGRFEIDFLPAMTYPSWGLISIRLIQDENNYYEICHTDGSGPCSEIKKVVNGQIIDSVTFGHDYFQDTLYQIAFIFTPDLSQISAFGELAVLNSDSSAITVNRFEVESAQQDAFYDNIVYSSEPGIRIINPASFSLQESDDLAVQLIAGPLQPGWGAKIVMDLNVVTDLIAPFETTFVNLLPGEYSIDAFIIDGSGVDVPGDNTQDSVNTIGVGGRYYVAMGNSITKGLDDDDPSDDISLDGRNSGGGYEPILNDLLTAYEGIPHTIVNEGVPGDRSVDGRLIISDLLVKHPDASRFLVQYGTNDASVSSPPTPSGLGLSPGNPGYPGTFKDNMQQIIDAIQAAGKDVYLAKSPITLAQCETCAPYPDPPSDGAKNLLILEYNEVIDELFADPLNSINVVPPDFFDYFNSVDLGTGNPRYEDQYATQLHPNGAGYDSMADLWLQAITP